MTNGSFPFSVGSELIDIRELTYLP